VFFFFFFYNNVIRHSSKEFGTWGQPLLRLETLKLFGLSWWYIFLMVGCK